MQAQYNNRHVTEHIFSDYIMKMRTVPGRQANVTQKEKEKEKKLFEMIDDYIEQA